MLKNKERFTLNFRKNPVITIPEIEKFLEKVNQKKYGKKVTLNEIIADCIKHYGPREIKRLRHSSMSSMDLIRMKYDREMEKSGKKITFEDYMAIKMGVKGAE